MTTKMWREICGAALTFCILFWNCENYFDPFDNPQKNDNEFLSGAERHWTWQRFERKRDGIAQTILSAGDVSGELPARRTFQKTLPTGRFMLYNGHKR